MASVNDGLVVVFCLQKSAASLEGDVSLTGAEGKLSPSIHPSSSPSEPSVESGSPQQLKAPSLPSFLRDHLSPDVSGHSLSDVSKPPQLTPDELLSCFVGQAFFQEFFADHVCILCIYLFSILD